MTSPEEDPILQRIERLLEHFNETPPEIRADAQALVQALLDLHARALKPMLESVNHDASEVSEILDTWTHTPEVASVLSLHGLHPVAPAARIDALIERSAASMARSGLNVRVLSFDAGVLNLQIWGNDAGGMERQLCQSLVEEIPEVEDIVVQRNDPTLVSIASLRAPRAS